MPSTATLESASSSTGNYKPLGVYEIVTAEIVDGIIEKNYPHLEIVKYKAKSGTVHEHFNSVMYHITIQLKNKNNGLENEITLMFKSIPKNPLRISWIRDAKLFLKEAIMYQEVLPKLIDFNNCKFTSFPRILDAFSDGFTDFIAMEDLAARGFKMADRLPGLDWEHSVLTVKELASFHALSFMKYNGDGERMQINFPEIREHFWKYEEPVPEMQQRFIFNTMRDIENVMKEEKLEHLIPRIRREFVDNVFQRISILSTVPTKFPSALSHGDCWTNNIMYKYSSEGHPEELKFIDFQKAMINSRCTDLSYFIYTSLSTPVVNDKLEMLLKLYYDSFNEICSKYELKLPLSFKGHDLTWDYFMEEWKFYHHFGLIYALMLIPLMYVASKDVPDMELLDISDIKPNDDQQDSQFAKMWKSRTMREKLINLISNHLPK